MNAGALNAAPHLALVCFPAGPWPVALQADAVQGAQPGDANQRPFTLDAWEMAQTQHSPYPPHSPPAPYPPIQRLTLLLQGPEGLWPLPICGPLELLNVPLEQLHPLPPLVAARCRLPALRALLLPGPGQTLPTLVLDAAALWPKPSA